MITVELDARQAQVALNRLARAVGDTRPVNTKVGIALYGIVIRNFETEGVEVTGRRWKDLAAGGRYTGKGKDRRFQTAYQILQDTGQLRASFHHFATRDVAGVGAKRYAARRGRKAPPDLAKLHQEGGRRLPKREMLPRVPQATKVALQVYRVHVAEARAKAGL